MLLSWLQVVADHMTRDKANWATDNFLPALLGLRCPIPESTAMVFLLDDHHDNRFVI